jgi:hypothetical protein
MDTVVVSPAAAPAQHSSSSAAGSVTAARRPDTACKASYRIQNPENGLMYRPTGYKGRLLVPKLFWL